MKYENVESSQHYPQADDKLSMKAVRIRSLIVLLSTCLILGLIVTVFWYQDWQYSLPTIRPIDLKQIALGGVVPLAKAGLTVNTHEPVFLHFFNPDCPCSRFNVDHIRSLTRKHHRQVHFVAVLQGEGDKQRLTKEFEDIGLGIESVVDDTGEIAKAVGVYATPQAVLLDSNGRLYFRGNYNLSRYCTSTETEYARIALESLLNGKPANALGRDVITAYGCPFPKRQSSGARIL